MRRIFGAATAAALGLMAVSVGAPPDGDDGKKPAGNSKAGPGKSSTSTLVGSPDGLAGRLMAFDRNNDGQLTKDEVTDERLHPLFDRIDANNDGIVTGAEVAAFSVRMADDDRRGGPGGGFGGGPPGGPGGRGGPPRPGQIMPPGLQQMLGLSESQMKQVSDLQKQVDTKLDAILTDAQKKQMKEMQTRGPGGRGGPGGGRGGPDGGGPGGPPGGGRQSQSYP